MAQRSPGDPYPWLRNNISSFTESLGPWYENQVQGKGRPFQGMPQGQAQGSGNIPMDEIMGLANKLYRSDPLSEQEEQRLTELTQRERRLQPMDTDRVYGGSRIPGNPYSIDTRQFGTGAANLVKGVVNNIRRKRREGYEGELTDLASQQATNQQAAQGRSKFLGDMIPEAYKQQMQNFRNTQDNQTKIAQTNTEEQGKNKRNTEDIKGREDLENLRFKHDKKLTEIENSLEGNKDFAQSATVFNDLSSMADEEIALINSQLETTNRLLNNDLQEGQQQKYEQNRRKLLERKNQLLDAKGMLHSEGGNYNNPANVQKYIDVLKGNTQQTQPTGEDPLVAPNNQGQQMTPDMIRQIVSEMLNESGSPNPQPNQDPDYDPNDPSTW